MRVLGRAAVCFVPAVLVALFLPSAVSADVIRVPGDRPLISLAVAAAKPGDVVEVEDGFYFEKNIVIDKAITVRSRNLFGAVVSGSDEKAETIFLVRSPCTIAGFILKDARVGILQRDSLDMEWTGRNLALIRMERGIAVDDRESRRGAARLSDIIVDKCTTGFNTNDARKISVSRAFVASTNTVFAGSNHLTFEARDVVTWKCRQIKNEGEDNRPSPSPSDAVSLGPGIFSFEAGTEIRGGQTLQTRLNGLFSREDGGQILPPGQLRRREAFLLLMVGDIALQGGNPKMAQRHYQSALDIDPATPVGEVTWRALIGMASASEALGDQSAAVAFSEKAIEKIERIGALVPIQAFQNSFAGDKIGIYESLIGRLVDLHRSYPGRGFDREALRYAEKSRARGFLVGLRLFSTQPPVPALQAGTTQWIALNRDVSGFQLRLQNPDLSAGQRAELLAQLSRAETDRAAVLIDMRRKQLESGRLKFPEPCGFDEIRKKLLTPENGLLEFVLGERKSFAFLATTGGLEIAVLPPAEELRLKISHYLSFLTLRETGDFRGREGARILSAALLEPFRDRLARGLKTLFIIPDGALHYLPFETLLMTRDGRERFLVEEFEMVYGPSASGLIRLAERWTPSDFTMDFLGLANTREISIFNFSEPERIRFPELPFGVREIRAIRDFFPRDRTTILWGDEAREDVLKDLPLSAYRVIHFVAHGFFDDRNWPRSSLLLLPGKNGVEDGFVQTNDITGLRLYPELLVLSGCQTGAGYLQKGEGLTGLASSFFFAGARSILLSLWNVNDRAASVFMESFYRHFSGGMGKAEALRRAKLEMLDSSFRHPFYWASFVLQGR